MYLPMATPPVKVIRSTCSLVSSSSAISFGSPVTTDSISGAARLVKKVSEQNGGNGTFSEGLSTMRLLLRRSAPPVRHLIHRVVERRDRRDHAEQGRALRIDAPFLPWCVRSQLKTCPSSLSTSLAPKQENIADAARFCKRILHAKARLRRRSGAATSSLRRFAISAGAVENGSTLIARELRPVSMPGTEGRAPLPVSPFGTLPMTLRCTDCARQSRARRAITADALAVDAHGVEVMI